MHLVDENGTVLPAGFVATSNDGEWPIGHGGLLYVAPARPGALRLDVDLGFRRTCDADLMVPANVTEAPDPCTLAERE